jgi:hypothetical protein
MNVVESRDSQVGKECRGDESCEGCNDREQQRRRRFLKEIDVEEAGTRKGRRKMRYTAIGRREA